VREWILSFCGWSGYQKNEAKWMEAKFRRPAIFIRQSRQ
jgi:hypothetical protein